MSLLCAVVVVAAVIFAGGAAGASTEKLEIRSCTKISFGINPAVGPSYQGFVGSCMDLFVPLCIWTTLRRRLASDFQINYYFMPFQGIVCTSTSQRCSFISYSACYNSGAYPYYLSSTVETSSGRVC
jgi:hypothetical protein